MANVTIRMLSPTEVEFELATDYCTSAEHCAATSLILLCCSTLAVFAIIASKTFSLCSFSKVQPQKLWQRSKLFWVCMQLASQLFL